MNYLYMGQGDLFLPAVAAALHQGRLDADKTPGKRDLTSLEHFRAGEREDGRLYCLGEDEQKNKVYITCVESHPDVVQRAITSLLVAYRIDLKEVVVRPCLPENPQVVTISRLLGKLRLKGSQESVACRLAQNRFSDLAKIAAKQGQA